MIFIIYAKNHVHEINEHKAEYKLLHVPRHENPVDLLSRGQPLKVFRNSELWFYDPSWLQTKEWPVQKEHVTIHEITTEVVQQPDQSPLFDITCYSGLNKMLSVTNLLSSFLSLNFQTCI